MKEKIQALIRELEGLKKSAAQARQHTCDIKEKASLLGQWNAYYNAIELVEKIFKEDL